MKETDWSGENAAGGGSIAGCAGDPAMWGGAGAGLEFGEA
jgi:hypothetical protein